MSLCLIKNGFFSVTKTANVPRVSEDSSEDAYLGSRVYTARRKRAEEKREEAREAGTCYVFCPCGVYQAIV